jgi:hypothetical protein
MDRVGDNPESYLNTTILQENAITFSSSRIVSQGDHVRFQRKNSFHSFIFSNVFPGYCIAGDATAAGAGAHAKIPKERDENVGLSSSPEPIVNL